MPFRTSPRLKAFDYVGIHRYSVTICTAGRHRAFTADADVSVAVTQLRIAANGQCFAVIAYCFMPDHIHLLLEGTSEKADLCEFVRMFKQLSSFRWKRSHGSVLWQRNYFEHVLRADEDTVTVARYVLANPVRAGLVECPEKYPFSGSFVMSIGDLLESVRRT